MLGSMPLYLSLKRLRKYLFSLIPHFPKYYKHSVGERLINTIMDCVRNISVINRSRNNEVKTKCINSLFCDMDILADLIDVLVGDKIISNKQCACLLEQMNDIERQCGGIKKSIKKD